MAGMASQTGTSHSSLATPPSTVQPVRQSSMAPPTQRMTSQPSHQLSVSSAAAAAPAGKTRPQSGNLLQSPESGFGGRQQGPRQQLSVKDSTPPGLPHQQSSTRESQGSQGSQGGTPQSTQQSKSHQERQQIQQQHLLKPTMSKQVFQSETILHSPCCQTVLLSSSSSFVCDLYTCIFKNPFQVICDGKSWKKNWETFLLSLLKAIQYNGQ